MRSTELLRSIYSDLDQRATKLKTLGPASAEEKYLALDSPEGLSRYAQILRPNILAALNSNRNTERLIIGCLVALLALACVLAYYGNVHDHRLVVAATIPGLGFAAWWPIVTLLRLRREDVALQILPDLLPLLSAKDAAEIVKKFLLSALMPGDPRPTSAARIQKTAIIASLSLTLPCIAQAQRGAAHPIEPRIERERRPELRVGPDSESRRKAAEERFRLHGLTPVPSAGEIDPSPHLLAPEVARMFREQRVRQAAAAYRWSDLSVRADAIALASSLSFDSSSDWTARTYLDHSNELLLARADSLRASGDLNGAVSNYEEVLKDPDPSFGTRDRAESGFRDSLYTLGLRSYNSHAWGDAADAMEKYVSNAPADARSQACIQILAKSLFRAAVSDYAHRDWRGASLAFEKLVGENPKANLFSYDDAAWARFNRYVRSNPSLRESSNSYLARARHFLDATEAPAETAFIDVLKVSESASVEVPYRLHVFNSTGDLDVVVSANNIDEAMSSVELKTALASTQAISSVVLVSAASDGPRSGAQAHEMFEDKIVWNSASVHEAAATLKSLQELHPKTEDFSLAMLLPKNKEQKQKLGLENMWSTTDQQRTWESARSFVKRSGIEVITEKVNRDGIFGWVSDLFASNDTQERLFDALMQKKNVLIFIAHGDREHLHSPDGTSIAVADIKKLQLSYNKPTVFLFSCEGGKTDRSDTGPTLADALKDAGASAVWSFAEKLDAGEAMSAAESLLAEVKRGRSMMDAMTALARTLRKLGGPKVYLRVQLNRLVFAEPIAAG